MKSGTLRFLLALIVAFALMMAFRVLAMTVYTISDDALMPQLSRGDRVLVNRWSYGLRVSGGALFSYGRIGRQQVNVGDLVVVDSDEGDASTTSIFRCAAVPGDTVTIDGLLTVVPSLEACADADYYLMEDCAGRGFVREEQIIGRVTHIVYSHNLEAPLWMGWGEGIMMPL